MENCPLAMVHLLLLSVMVVTTAGDWFKFHLLGTQQDFSASEQLCKDRGYDGLAIVSSPEAYDSAMSILVPLGTGAGNEPAFVGLRYTVATGQMTWDDGTTPASDTPGLAQPTAQELAKLDGQCQGRIQSSGKIAVKSNRQRRDALCGNHKTRPSEGHGSSADGQKPGGVSSTLSLGIVPSYLECSALCGHDSRCRAAHFTIDHSTCTLLGPGSYTGLIADPASRTFIRKEFTP